jgi:hypothetical protein
VSHDGTRQLAHSEGEYIHPENAGWYWFYLDPVRLGDGNRNSFYSFYSGVCPMAYQHLPAKQDTRKAEYFSKGSDRFNFRGSLVR